MKIFYFEKFKLHGHGFMIVDNELLLNWLIYVPLIDLV